MYDNIYQKVKTGYVPEVGQSEKIIFEIISFFEQP